MSRRLMLSIVRLATALVGALTVEPALAGPPTFELLPSLPSTGPSGTVVARGISGDGQVVVGSLVPLMWESPFLWRKVDGMWVLVPLPGEGNLGWGRPVSVSHDGNTIAGMTNRYMATAVASGTPAVWTDVLSGTPTIASPLDDSGPADLRRGVFGGISSNGGFTAGFAQLRTPTSSVGELWGYADGAAARLSPSPSTSAFASALLAGNAVSGDGSIVVGSVYDGVARRAFRWTVPDGFFLLPTPSSGSYRNSRAECISRDGAVIGGHTAIDHTIYNTQALPCVWVHDTRIELPLPPGRAAGRVFGLSGDGSIAVGVQYNLTLGLDIDDFAQSRAVFWFHKQPQLLSAYLTSRGVDLQGISPHWLTGVSDDGRTLVGFGSAGDGTVPSFVVTLATTCLGDLTEDEILDLADYLEFLDLYDAADPRVDFTGDSQVDFADYLEFLNLYEQGC